MRCDESRNDDGARARRARRDAPAPPKAAATNPKTAVVWRPTMGETPATKANATASGIIARLTAKPLRAFFAADSGLNGFNACAGPAA